MMNFGYYGGDWNNVPNYMQQMMQNYYGGIAPFGGLLGFLQVVICLLLIVLLVVLIRYFWLKAK